MESIGIDKRHAPKLKIFFKMAPINRSISMSARELADDSNAVANHHGYILFLFLFARTCASPFLLNLLALSFSLAFFILVLFLAQIVKKEMKPLRFEWSELHSPSGSGMHPNPRYLVVVGTSKWLYMQRVLVGTSGV